MGIGAILTSGGCRALKGMALLGAGFALGAVEAAAQLTVTVPDTVDEGGRLTISASATVQIAAGADASTVDLTVTPAATAADAVSAPKTPAEEGDSQRRLRRGDADSGRAGQRRHLCRHHAYEDTVTLRATVAGATTDRLDPLEIDVADIHALPAGDDITAKAYLDDGNGAKTGDEATSVTEGGDPVHVTVTVDRGANGYPAGEKLEVAVTADDDGQSRDYRVDPASVDIDSGTGEQSMDFKLWASPDDDVGAEELVLSLVATGETAANGPGQSTGTFTIAIADDTTKQVEPVSAEAAQAAVDAALAAAVGDEGLNPGESFTVMATDLFTVTAGYTARYTASATGGAAQVSTTGASVTVTAESAGTATVTVTATTTEASSATVSQTVANSADCHVRRRGRRQTVDGDGGRRSRGERRGRRVDDHRDGEPRRHRGRWRRSR